MRIDNVNELATNLLDVTYIINGKTKYSVNLLKLGYKFEFNNRVRSLGLFRPIKKTIELSKPTINLNLNNKDLIEQTLLHEIAHAIDYEITGNVSHGKSWKFICNEIGYKGKRTVREEDINTPKRKYSMVCTTCKNETGYSRRPKINKSCGICKPVYDKNYLLKLVQNY